MTDCQETRARKYTVPRDTRPVEAILEIKKSEFIGHIARVESEDEARRFIETLRKRYHDARHVCSAFVIGADREIQRSSDDGDPAGTAGIPMLQAVLSHRTDGDDESVTDLSDLCAVVVRYFGGVKLGAGGLVRAYTDATVNALAEAHLIPRRRLRHGLIHVPHAQAGRLENELRAEHFVVLGTDYSSSQATLTIAVPDDAESLSGVEARIAAHSSGRWAVTWAGTDWVDG
ncbi:IMPACT family protein [Kocuria massiliensis]|uniref:IMPACT family protein n=1 Tax=Kocuria massiliensis TaxID=1926282 RepID=UPI000A1CA895|nr:YigZ family protein [Kocuria massiliensis]